ncbi:MAG: insulinase family protein [Myxococcota bacterium]|nr:insulinase family protein [Myxococcota bacterium]
MTLFFFSLLYAQPDRTQIPSMEPLEPVQYPKAEYFETRFGYPVWYYRDTRFPLVQFYIDFDAGLLHNTEPNALAIAAAGWKRGPRWRSDAWWLNRLAILGAEPLLQMNQTSAVAEISVLEGYEREGLRLLKDTLHSPNRSGWNTHRKEVQTSTRSVRSLHFELIQLLVYGVRKKTVVSKSYRKCDLSRAYAEWKNQAKPRFVIVGNVDIESLLPQFDRFWNEARDAKEDIYERKSRPSHIPPQSILNYDAGHQAAISLIIPHAKLSMPEWLALEQLNFILGGSFGSRLSSVLREQEGLSYTVGSRLRGNASFGFLEISLMTTIEEIPAVRMAIESVLSDLKHIQDWEYQKIGSVRTMNMRMNLMDTRYVARNLIRFQSADWKEKKRREENITQLDLERAAQNVIQNQRKGWVLTGNAKEILSVLKDKRWDVYDRDLKIDTLFP